jgi:hypothetical protein
VTAPADAEGDRARAQFVALLDDLHAQSRTIRFWWRDDDAETLTPALERLLALQRKHAIPIGLAVIPKGATSALADRLAGETDVAVLQHGWEHRNHASAGEKKVEIGGDRPGDDVMRELRLGFERLARLFPAVFLPALVPPWNRIAPAVRDAREQASLPGLSTFGPAPEGARHWVNTHLDIIDWTMRQPLSRAVAFSLLCREVERRLAGNDEPVGIITHHLVHTGATWALLGELLSLTADHPAVVWPRVGTLFDLSPVGAAM